MKKILLMALIAIGLNADGQDTTINKLEYFIDKDPGPGKGIAIPVAPSENLTLSFDVDLSGLATGYHIFYLRTRDNLGRWSLTARRNIEVLPGTPNPIEIGEYFIDKDPGYGNGKRISIAKTGEEILEEFAASIAGANIGYHLLYGRVRDKNGNWSQTFRRNIEVVDNENKLIVEGEYFFKTDNGFGKGSPVTFTVPAADGSFTFNIPTGQIPTDADTLFVRVKQNGENHWSLTRWTAVSTALPLTWLDFTAQKKQDVAMLLWQTTNEINTSFFRVQRSLNGLDFKDIGTVPAINSRNINQYSYEDNVAGINSEKLFYRLQQTDINSAFTQSKIIAITNVVGKTSIAIYPNPFSEYLIIKSTNSNDLAGAVLTITDLSGRKMSTKILAPLETQKVNLGGLSKGVYLVQIRKQSGNELFKVIKE